MIFLNPLDALIPKIPFSFFAAFWVRVTSGARGSVSVGFWGGRQLSPFWEGGGSGRRALSTPFPSPASESPPTQAGTGGVRTGGIAGLTPRTASSGRSIGLCIGGTDVRITILGHHNAPVTVVVLCSVEKHGAQWTARQGEEHRPPLHRT